MDDALQQQIFDAAPVFYQKRSLPCTHTCMCWGIECGDGWFKPLLEFSKKAEAVNELLRPYGCCIVADQVKSKWADIRVYWDIVPLKEDVQEDLCEHDEFIVKTIESLFENAVDHLESECENTCEICGAKGDYNNKIFTCGSWLTHKCRACAQKRERDSGTVVFFRDGFNFLSPYTEGQVSYGGTNYGCFMGLYYSELHPEHKVIFRHMKNPREVQVIAFDMGLCEQTERAVDVMRRVLEAKFNNKELRGLLMDTKGLDLVYSNQFHENFWGSCICNECKDNDHHNHYGRMLMELRDGIGSKKDTADGK